ncbi:hypothetical protein BGP_5312 [Beggiatoa sp. PS]|nr:hypothetical protein BGP_5312 [Beggiatoa sp. PS]
MSIHEIQWFRARLRGHFVLIQVGNFWEMRFSYACRYRFHHRHLTSVGCVLRTILSLPIICLHRPIHNH